MPQAKQNRVRGEMIALAESDQLATTRVIQVLRSGNFTDMHGTYIEVTPADLDIYIANSNQAASVKQLPIELGHPSDPGAPAAAWYKTFTKKVIDGVEWVCAEIELTSLGAQSLAEKLYKYFSANLDLSGKVISGGGFVNRPAVSGQQPIGALSEFLQEKNMKRNLIFSMIADGFNKMLARLEMSQEDAQSKIRNAIQKKYADPIGEYGSYPYPIATFDDRVIVVKEQKYFAIPYSFDESNECVLGEPVEVEMTWQPISDSKAQLAQPKGGEKTMPTVEEQLAQARKDAEQAILAQRAEFDAQLAKAREEGAASAKQAIERKQQIAQLAAKLTSGAKQFPYTAQELEDALAKLTDDDRAIIAPILEKVQVAGLVQMSEQGTAQDAPAKKQLPSMVKPILSAWLAGKETVENFFAVNPELGKAEEYDLTEFFK